MKRHSIFYLLTVAFLFTCSTLLSRNYLTYHPSKNDSIRFLNILKITPAKMQGAYSPSVELTYERKTSNHFSTSVMASYLLSNSLMDVFNGIDRNAKGVRFALEEKFYFKKTAPAGFYLGLELDYLKRDYDGRATLLVDTAPYIFSGDVRIKRQSYSLNLKSGYQFFAGHFAFEVYAGLGIRYRDVKNVYSDPQMNTGNVRRHGVDKYDQHGSYFTLSLPINFRIGWAF